MAPYQHHVNVHHRQKRARRMKKVAKLSVGLVAFIALFITLDWVWNSVREAQPKQGIESRTSVQSSTINVFRTPYFQFQADRTWSEVKIENGSNNTFIYRSYNDYLVQHEIKVVVNSAKTESLDNTRISHVLPVEIRDNNLHAIGEISPHCKDLIPNENNKQQQYVDYKGTKFACNPDSSTFEVIIGLVGGDSTLVKESADSKTTYTITYRDSTFTPTGHNLAGIINSFQLL